jgi:hypothetical protein
VEKIGKLTEARMVIAEEPKMYPLISDKNFNGTLVAENAKKGYKGIKGGTAAAKKEAERRMKKRSKLEEEELAGKLPKDKPTPMSDMTTNSPRRATPKSVQVGGPYDLTAEANLQELTPAGEQAAKLRKREKEFDAAGKPFDAGRMAGRRKHNIATRRARPRVSPNGRVPGKSYREDPVK